MLSILFVTTWMYALLITDGRAWDLADASAAEQTTIANFVELHTTQKLRDLANSMEDTSVGDLSPDLVCGTCLPQLRLTLLASDGIDH